MTRRASAAQPDFLSNERQSLTLRAALRMAAQAAGLMLAGRLRVRAEIAAVLLVAAMHVVLFATATTMFTSHENLL